MKKEKHLMVEDDIIADNDVKKEFNLSDKETYMKGNRGYYPEYVKEFIKRLKEEVDYLNLELVFTDFIDVATKERISIPEDIRIILERYTEFIIEKLIQKTDKLAGDKLK